MPYLLQPTITQNNPYGQVATFSVTGIQPPAAEYVNAADQIVVRISCPNASATVTVGVRLLSTTGLVSPSSTVYQVTATAGTASVQQFAVSEGFLLSALVSASGVLRGQCYVQVYLQRGQGGADPMLGELLVQGYVSNTEWLSFPRSIPESSLAGVGYVYPVPMGTVAAGSPVSITVPPGVRWRLIAVPVTIGLPGPSSPNGFLTLETLDPSGNAMYNGSLLQEASFGPIPSSLPGGFSQGAGGVGIIPNTCGWATDAWLLAGSTIRLSYVEISSGAITFSPAFATVEEFVEV